ncbi:MAG: hypothetical protein Q9178_005052 [Gyalolechia marmorata]
MHYESRRQSLAPIRAVLEPLLETIETEIRSLEPGSSQESINKICQVSIFDRTASSSDSVPSIPSLHEARTPHRPSPLPLAHETLWGTDVRKPSLESPASIGSARGPRIVENSPCQVFYDDFGYESDRETLRVTSQAMHKTMSERTERPQTATTKKTHQEDKGWQVVPSNRRYRKTRLRRDLGSFRPTPARPTRAKVDRKSATGTVARSTERPIDRGSSQARKALSEVHSRSPTPPRRNLSSNLTSFWQRRPLASTNNSARTWADVVASQEQHPRVQPLPPTLPPIIPQPPNPPSIRQENPSSSPLSSELHPDGPSHGPGLENSARFTAVSSYYTNPPRTQPTSAYYPSPAPGSGTNPPQPRYINHDGFSNPTQVIGSNPSRLPYTNIDDSISLCSKRRLPSDFHDPTPTPYPTTTSIAPPRGHSPSSYPSPGPVYEPYYPNSHSYQPTGYYSQPMSRDASHQSHISAAETEPPHYHTPSPFPPHHQRNASFSVEPPSPRDRYPNGGPLRKSPRSDHSVPVGLSPSNNISSKDLSQSLPSLGGWTLDNASHTQPMSGSSSGPGIAIQNYGLGIVPFDGHLRFGEQSPFSVEEARRRTSEWEERLARDRESSRGRERRRIETRVTPYPDERAITGYPELNLIPTQSNSDALRAMVDGRGR